MNEKTILALLKHPFFEALVSDFVVFMGMDKLRHVLQKKDTVTTQTDGTTTTAKTAENKTPKIPGVLLGLADAAKRREIAAWIPTLTHAQKSKVEKMSDADLIKFLELARDERLEILETFDDTIPEAMKKVWEKVDHIGAILPKTAEQIELLGKWGKAPDPPDSEFVLRVNTYANAGASYIKYRVRHYAKQLYQRLRTRRSRPGQTRDQRHRAQLSQRLPIPQHRPRR